MESSADTRSDLLRAATRLILREGAARLTLAAVAAEAGVSKGGLLYHFPTKDALIEGLIEHYAHTFAAQVTALAAGESGPQPLLRAYVRATFAEEGASRELGAAVLGAALLNPGLLPRFREQLQGAVARLEAGAADPARATAVRLAADGLWFTELLGLTDLAPSARGALERCLLELLEAR
ncbi:transcriptional regulator, TetR family [Truepera radiovictrix DSM 17093]|uniref:Transcriptional regulator, TetR family n=2 Tax=Truepera TaxID=332248 RepID=D7CRU8_TRURR|nr:transcriptional regulator, TetR family [Truepera radiovictrix DSM 17093]